MTDRPLRILLVEDNATDALLVRESLANAGDTTVETARAERLADGIARLEAGQFDVILLDLALPDSSGIESLIRLRQLAEGTPIVVLTGNSDEDLGLQAMQEGAQDFLKKQDISPALLSRTIRYSVERGRVEETLRSRERQLRQAQIIAHLGSWEWEVKSGQLSCSEELEEVFGCDPRNLLSDMSALLTRIQPGEKSVDLSTLEPFEFEERFVGPDGSVRYLFSRGEVVKDREGNPVKLRGISQDITRLKLAQEAVRHSERRFRAIIGKSSDGFSVSNAEGEWLFLSDSSKEILGYTPEELVGRSRFDLVHPDDLSEVRRIWEDLKQRPGSAAPMQYRIRKKDGSSCWMESIFTNLLADPAVRGIVGNHRDITERRQSEERLKQHALELSERNDELARFNRVAVGRELRMVELKQEVDELCRRLGEEPRYRPNVAGLDPAEPADPVP